MIKKSLAFVLVLCLLCTLLSACGNRSIPSPLTVGTEIIDSETFTYFLDRAYAGSLSDDARMNKAVAECVRYAAISGMFRAYGLSMSDDEIATASEEASLLWNMFGEYYRKEGVSKATFVRIHIASKYTEKLRTAIFGSGGTEEIEDAYLRGALKEFFIAYKTVTVPLYSKNVYGTREPFTSEQINDVRHAMSDGAQKLNNGQNIEAVASSVAVDYPLAQYSYTTTVYGPSRHDITQEFIDAVKSMEENTAGTIEMDDTIYIVYRIDILSDTEIFEDNRQECLEILSDSPLEQLISAACETLTPVKNASAASDCDRNVRRAKLG